MGLSVKGKFPDLSKASNRVKRILPSILANEAKNHYLEGFKLGGKRTDSSASGWAKRKKKDKNRARRAILVKTGHLRSDLDIRRTTLNEIVLGTNDTDYASYLNEGTEHMEAREFLGKSRKLDLKIKRTAINEMNKYFDR